MKLDFASIFKKSETKFLFLIPDTGCL